MPSKNKKQLNFFLLVKAYKESGENGVFRQLKHLEGYKPRLTPTYMNKLIKTAESIADSDLIDMTSGVEGENPLGDTRNLKANHIRAIDYLICLKLQSFNIMILQKENYLH